MARRRKPQATFSLFSFQDIITSVTGIFILVTLVLALSLTQQKSLAPQVQTDLIADDLRSAIQLLSNELDAIQNNVSTSSVSLNRIASLSPENIARDLEILSQQVESLNAENQRLESRDRLVAKEQRLVTSQVEEELAGHAETLRETQQSIELLEQQLEELENSNRIIYNTPSQDGKSQWIVEIRANQIGIAPAGKKQSPVVFTGSDCDSEFQTWIRRNLSSNTDYFLLVVTPKGISTFNDIEDIVKPSGYAFGIELVPEDATVLDSVTGAGI